MKTFILGLVLGAIISGGAVWLYQPARDAAAPAAGTNATSSKTRSAYTVTKLDTAQNTGGGASMKRFTHEKLGFSLTYPATHQVKRFEEGGGAETIVFQKPSEKHGFQIFITPYDKETITRTRLEKDVPSGVIKERTQVMIGENSDIRAAAFLSKNDIIGKTREVWFIKNDHLFEVTTYRRLDSWLARIMDTLRFQHS